MSEEVNSTNENEQLKDTNEVNEQEIAKEQKEQQTDNSNAALLSQIEDLKKQMKDVELRSYAEVENMRKRAQKDVESANKYALTKFATDLLPVIDALEKALESIDSSKEEFKNVFEGINLTLKSMNAVTNRYGIEQLNPIDQPFDPNTQHAISMIDAPEGKQPNTVLTVVQKGYNLNGRNIRPAMVVVTKPAPIEEKV